MPLAFASGLPSVLICWLLVCLLMMSCQFPSKVVCEFSSLGTQVNLLASLVLVCLLNL